MTVTDRDIDRPSGESKMRVGETLVPSDDLYQESGRASLEGPHTTIRVHMRIVYRTIDGGTEGQLIHSRLQDG
jgi:hypothetical protein